VTRRRVRAGGAAPAGPGRADGPPSDAPAPPFAAGVRRGAYALCFAIAALGLALGQAPWWGDTLDRPRLDAVGVGALCWFLALARLPWHRLPAGLLVLEPLSTVALVALGIAATGGADSPLNACYPLIVILAALYHHQPVRALPIGAAVALAGLAPLGYAPAAAAAAPRLVAFALSYALGALACALLGRELLRRERAHARALARADRDALTGVLGRQAILARLDAALASTGDGAVAVLFLDLDHFKAVNDGYGHATGDRVLQELCRRVAAALPATGALGRYGGEEFVAVLPATGAAAAARVAAAVRRGVADAPFAGPAGLPLRLTLSVGVAATTPGDTGRRDLLHRADTALYRAKQAGRDRVAVDDDGAPPDGTADAGHRGVSAAAAAAAPE
jgi:diguanylate cyclase (GGDEF)-like protein